MQIENSSSNDKGVFEAREEDRSAGKINYSIKDESTLVIEHTEVNPDFQGKGVGKKLVQEAADYARKNNFKISPQCSYAKKVMERTSDYDDVLS